MIDPAVAPDTLGTLERLGRVVRLRRRVVVRGLRGRGDGTSTKEERGTGDGERNDLSLKNEFTFVLERTPAVTDELPIRSEEGFKK